MGRQRRHAHRDDGPLGGRQRPDRRQELVGPRPVDHAQDRVAALASAGASADAGPRAPRWRSTSRRRTSPSTSRLVAEGDRPIASASSPTVSRAAVGQDVERGQLGEPEAQLAELAGEPDHQLAPQRAAHRDALADLADVREPVAGGQDRRGQVRLEPAGDGSGRAPDGSIGAAA